MTDLERIEAIEQELGFKLRRVELQDIGRKYIYTMDLYNYTFAEVQDPAISRKAARSYSLLPLQTLPLCPCL